MAEKVIKKRALIRYLDGRTRIDSVSVIQVERKGSLVEQRASYVPDGDFLGWGSGSFVLTKDSENLLEYQQETVNQTAKRIARTELDPT